MTDDELLAQKTNYKDWQTLVANNAVTNQYNLIYHGKDGKDWWTRPERPHVLAFRRPGVLLRKAFGRILT